MKAEVLFGSTTLHIRLSAEDPENQRFLDNLTSTRVAWDKSTLIKHVKDSPTVDLVLLLK